MMLLLKLKKTLCFAICSIVAVSYAYTEPKTTSSNEKQLGLKTVVLDPGHGGKDSGAPGQSSSTSEKHIVLKISKLLGEKITKAYPDVKVIYTRDKDVFVELNERAKIAKRNKADLFVSIHCNSNRSKTPFGASVHILGPKSSNKKNNGDYFEKSFSVAQRENSVMLLEDDYKTKYEGFDPNSPESIISHSLMWNANYENSLILAAEIDQQFHKAPFRVSNYTGIHQDVFYLLWATNMPAVLLELGFISNPADFKYLSTETGQKQVSDRLFDAFKKYKAYYEGSVDGSVGEVSSSPEKVAKTPVKAKDENPKAETKDKNLFPGSSAENKEHTYFAIQIMGLGRLIKSGDSAFKGLEIRAVKDPKNNVYKYLTSWSNNREDTASQLKTIRKKFPEAFIVKVSGNSVTRI